MWCCLHDLSRSADRLERGSGAAFMPFELAPKLRCQFGQNRDGGEQVDVAQSRSTVRIVAETRRNHKGGDVDVRVEDDTHSSVLEHQPFDIPLGPHAALARLSRPVPLELVERLLATRTTVCVKHLSKE